MDIEKKIYLVLKKLGAILGTLYLTLLVEVEQ